jgi:hypothetical protein
LEERSKEWTERGREQRGRKEKRIDEEEESAEEERNKERIERGREQRGREEKRKDEEE